MAAKYCAVCQENFGDKSSFCRVCGEPLKALEGELKEATAASPAPDVPTTKTGKLAAAFASTPPADSVPQLIRQLTVAGVNGASKPRNNLKTPLRPLGVVAFATAILIMFGTGFALFNAQLASSGTTNADSIQPTPIEDSKVTIAEEPLPQSVDNSQFAQEFADQPLPAAEAEESNLKESYQGKVLVDAPSTILEENPRPIRQKDKFIKLPQTFNNRRSAMAAAVREEPFEQKAFVEKKEIKNENQKGNGFKGFFNKIGSGVMHFPKMIFKSKKCKCER